MPFQLPSKKPFAIETSSFDVLLFPPFLAGSIVAFERALREADSSPNSFVRHFTAIQARKPCGGDNDIGLQYENGERVEVKTIQEEDIIVIAHSYLKLNEQEMAWYASGDEKIELEDDKWQPSQNVARLSDENEVQYFRRLAQECVKQSSASLNRIKDSFQSIVGISSLGRFALADLNATLSANRIRAIASSPAIHLENIKPAQVGIAHSPLIRDDALAMSLGELIAEVQKVSNLIAEQCVSARNQNEQTDLLIEASNQSSKEAVKSLNTAKQNLQWAKIGILLTTVFSLLTLVQSVITSHKQGIEESSRGVEAVQMRSLANSSKKILFSISNSLSEINKRIKDWQGATKK
jgi:hypothetical protein